MDIQKIKVGETTHDVKDASAYQKPANGIPASDLASEVQASLNKADTALQQHQDISNLATKAEIPTAVSELAEDSAHRTVTETEKGTWNGKQDAIADLGTIRSGAAAGATAYQVPVTGIPKTDLSESVQTSLGKADSALQEHQDLTPITEVIPAQATAQNQLADKNFVNSSVATNTAEFKGTYNSLDDLRSVSADNNDYGFVVTTDDAGNTVYNRYKYNGTEWVFEYPLNNSSFTAAQWAAIVSGITSGAVAKLGDLPTAVDLAAALLAKQDVIADLPEIRGGAAAGATAYQKPGSGIPDTDLSQGVNAALTKANSAYQKPGTGIAKSDLAPDVQTSLEKSDSALQSHQSLAGLAASVAYDSNAKRINFYDKDGTALNTYVDATAFIKDGMVSSVAISNGSLVISFNTEAGKEPISIPLTDIFNPENYYTRDEVDAAVNGARSNWINDGTSNVKLASTSSFEGTTARCVAEGNNNTVGELGETVANAHVEGNYCSARGNQAHAEGFYSDASGQHAHAEGRRTAASADGSHSEGYAANGTYLRASGQGAHVEGYAPVNVENVASGKGSHAEGTGTVAQNEAEHAEGQYNKSTSGKTLSSVGCGTSSGDRKNATEVHKDGTFYIKGVGSYDGTNAAPGTNDVPTVLAGKQDKLVSGQNVKTINGESILGDGDIRVNGSGNWESVGDNSVQVKGNKALASESSSANQKGAVAAGYQTYANKRYSSSKGQMTVAGVCTGDNPSANNYKRWYKNGDTITSVAFKTDSEGSRTIPETTIGDIGVGAHAEGIYSSAVGNNSHAEGNDTVALNSGCHSEGYHTIALGQQSHAEGNRTDAWGNQAHSEGKFTRATGEGAHAEGVGHNTSYPNLASAKGAHAEGQYTQATGEGAHAEGCGSSDNFNVASGEASHVEGKHTKATNMYSHAEGVGTVASGGAGHAEGEATEARGYASHAEGYGSKAISNTSHAEGESTWAGNNASHAEGALSSTSGFASHAEGCQTKAIGEDSHAEGLRTKAIGEQSHSEGNETEAYSYGAHTEGTSNMAYGMGAHAEGSAGYGTIRRSLAFGNGSHTEGMYGCALSGSSHAEGFYSIASAIAVKIGLQGSSSDDKIVYSSYLYRHISNETFNELYFTDDDDNEYCFRFDGDVLPMSSDAYLGEQFSWERTGINHDTVPAESDPGYYCKEVICLPSLQNYRHTIGEYGRVGHAEGRGTRTLNDGEHAQGCYNVSHFSSDSFGDAGNTLHSVGIGFDNGNAGYGVTRKNAFEIMQNGDVYVIGLGGYDGTNAGASGVKTLQQIISGL